jgi:hypothetical protein
VNAPRPAQLCNVFVSDKYQSHTFIHARFVLVKVSSDGERQHESCTADVAMSSSNVHCKADQSIPYPWTLLISRDARLSIGPSN